MFEYIFCRLSCRQMCFKKVISELNPLCTFCREKKKVYRKKKMREDLSAYEKQNKVFSVQFISFVFKFYFWKSWDEMPRNQCLYVALYFVPFFLKIIKLNHLICGFEFYPVKSIINQSAERKTFLTSSKASITFNLKFSKLTSR